MVHDFSTNSRWIWSCFRPRSMPWSTMAGGTRRTVCQLYGYICIYLQKVHSLNSKILVFKSQREFVQKFLWPKLIFHVKLQKRPGKKGGFRSYVDILNAYLERNLRTNGGVLDGVIFAMVKYTMEARTIHGWVVLCRWNAKKYYQSTGVPELPHLGVELSLIVRQGT